MTFPANLLIPLETTRSSSSGVPLRTRTPSIRLKGTSFNPYGSRNTNTGASPAFVSADGKYLLLVYPSINIWEREEMEKFLGEMRRIDPNVTGNAVHMFESSRLMIDAYIRAGLYALAAIFLYLMLM